MAKPATIAVNLVKNDVGELAADMKKESKSKKKSKKKSKSKSKSKKTSKKKNSKKKTTAKVDSKLLELFVTSVCIDGQRDHQEDRHSIVHSFAPPFDHLAMYAVFDGHGGHRCSEYLAQNFAPVVQALLDKKKHVSRPHIGKLLHAAVTKVVDGWDEVSLDGNRGIIVDDASRAAYFSSIDYDKFVDDDYDSGSTLVAVVVDRKLRRVHMVCLGDSRAAVHVPGRGITTTVDHAVPEKVPDSVKTNSAFNVTYVDGRVAGDVAMARAVGDNTDELVGLIGREPDTYVVNDIGAGTRIVVGSDGLFDVYDTQAIFLNHRDNAEDYISAKGEEHFDDNTTILLVHVK